MILSQYLVIIKGSNCLRVINALKDRNIPIFEVKFDKNVQFLIAHKNYIKLKNLAETYGVEVEIVSKSGLAKLAQKAIENLPYIIACCLCAIMLFSSLQFVYHTQINCSNQVYSNKVATLLKQNKINGVLPKRKIDLAKVENLILKNIEQVSFATCYIEGLTLKIDLVANDNPIIAEKKENLISNYDAIVTRVMVREGTSLVREGQRVSVGDVLIGGFHIADNTPTDGTETGEIFNCAADGEVYGKVYIHKRFLAPKQAITYVKTGKSTTISDLGFGELMLIKHKKTPYKNYEISVTSSKIYNILPISVKSYTYYELKKVVIDQKTYVEQIKNKFNKELIASLKSDARILSQKSEIKIVDGVSYLDINYEIEQRIDNGGHNY